MHIHVTLEMMSGPDDFRTLNFFELFAFFCNFLSLKTDKKLANFWEINLLQTLPFTLDREYPLSFIRQIVMLYLKFSLDYEMLKWKELQLHLYERN